MLGSKFASDTMTTMGRSMLAIVVGENEGVWEKGQSILWLRYNKRQ